MNIACFRLFEKSTVFNETEMFETENIFKYHKPFDFILD